MNISLPLYESSTVFFESIPKEGRLLGLDLGEKTIGIAVSDHLRTIATPMQTIKRTKFSKDLAELMTIISAENAAGLVLGLPKEMDGKEGKRCQSTRQFARNILKETTIPILLADERLSTVSAHSAMLEADLSRQKRAEKVDKMAASIILQMILDGKENNA